MGFSSYEHLCSQTDKMADHSQYSDVLKKELYRTTGLNKCGDFTGDNIGHIGSQDNDRENTNKNDADGVMETIEIRVEKSQNKKQLNNDGENCSAKDNNSKDEKTEMCEVADDKGANENNRRKCKSSNREEGVKSNNGIVEQDKSVPKTDEDNFATNKKCMAKGKKVYSTSRINLHPTEIIRNRVTNLPYSLLCALKYSKKENNGDEISLNRRPFEEYQHFVAQEQHRLNVPKLYPSRTSSRQHKLSLADMSYNSPERKTICPFRRTSESKVSAPLKRRIFSYSQNNNNSTELNSFSPPPQSSSHRAEQTEHPILSSRPSTPPPNPFDTSLSSFGNAVNITFDPEEFQHQESPFQIGSLHSNSNSETVTAPLNLSDSSWWSSPANITVDPEEFQHQVCPFESWDPDTSRWSRDFDDSIAELWRDKASPEPTSDTSGSCFSDYVAGPDPFSAEEINSHILNRKWHRAFYRRKRLGLRADQTEYVKPNIKQCLHPILESRPSTPPPNPFDTSLSYFGNATNITFDPEEFQHQESPFQMGNLHSTSNSETGTPPLNLSDSSWWSCPANITVDPEEFEHQVCPFESWDPDTSRWSRDFDDSIAELWRDQPSPEPTSDSSGSCFSDFIAGPDPFSAAEINCHILNRKWHRAFYRRKRLGLRAEQTEFVKPNIKQCLHPILGSRPSTTPPSSLDSSLSSFINVTWEPDTSRRSRDFDDSNAELWRDQPSPEPTSDSSGSCFSDFIAGPDPFSAVEINSHILNRKWHRAFYRRKRLGLRAEQTEFVKPNIKQCLHPILGSRPSTPPPSPSDTSFLSFGNATNITFDPEEFQHQESPFQMGSLHSNSNSETGTPPLNLSDSSWWSSPANITVDPEEFQHQVSPFETWNPDTSRWSRDFDDSIAELWRDQPSPEPTSDSCGSCFSYFVAGPDPFSAE
ncbi:Hypothetical predicted protein [Octopus vulgaris]|uniref:Uncharacterized protein n=1 Tax=Octopus vulgaris TaxID=6645 RepID=A0AA36AV65_OCTVU|nr:Hypothetical predicted protein [Octopus vulgaris]